MTMCIECKYCLASSKVMKNIVYCNVDSPCTMKKKTIFCRQFEKKKVVKK